MQGALAPSDAQAAAAALETDPPGVLDVVPPPPQLPGLVRYNPGLAAQLLLRLADVPEVSCRAGIVCVWMAALQAPGTCQNGVCDEHLSWVVTWS
jgi:hypothetical protein